MELKNLVAELQEAYERLEVARVEKDGMIAWACRNSKLSHPSVVSSSDSYWKARKHWLSVLKKINSLSIDDRQIVRKYELKLINKFNQEREK